MIDWSRVQDLRSEVGPDDFGAIVAVFLQEADEVVGRLMSLSDPSAIENDLHFLKGSALNLGFAKLAQVCQSGEIQAASGATDVAMQTVVDAYHQSRSVFLDGIKAQVA